MVEGKERKGNPAVWISRVQAAQGAWELSPHLSLHLFRGVEFHSRVSRALPRKTLSKDGEAFPRLCSLS